MTEIQRFSDGDALALAGADFFVQTAVIAIASRGKFTVALSGGSTPRNLHQLLTREPFLSQVDWSKVYVYWGDERTVPPDAAESNYKMARETLLEHVPIPEVQVHRMRGEIDPEAAATEYGRLIKAHFDPPDTRFDLIFLGMGDDGHTASLFPHTAALNEVEHRCVANFVPKLDTWRITLTAPVINSAANVVFLVGGASKAEALKAVIEDEYQPETYPSQLIAPEDGQLIWMVDEAAAALL
ncbi:MAG: 6-phosphogluconolactonase [Aggregatilineales bacterium]